MSDTVAKRQVVRLMLGPCARTGDPAADTDWWAEQHVWCDGTAVLRPGVVVTCTCPCHTDKDSPEAVARAAAEHLAHDRAAMDAGRTTTGYNNWRDIRQVRSIDDRFPG
jgi:hypothetical protein